jgi:hypothetical protein
MRYLIAVAVLASQLAAQPADTSNAAKAKAVVMRHMDAIGGLDAYSAISSFHVSYAMQFSIGFEQRAEMWFAKPNLVYGRFRSEYGTGEGGFDGKVYWTVNSDEGPRVYPRPPESLAAAMFDPYQSYVLFQPKYVEQKGEKPTEVLQMIGPDGELYTQYFNARSGLLERLEVGNPNAPVASIRFDRYRKFGKLQYATVIRTKMDEQELVTRVIDVDFKPVDRKRFEPPSQVRALVGRTP